jgi:hypothetical protein
MALVSLSCSAERRFSSAGCGAALSLGEEGGIRFLALTLADPAKRSFFTMVSP